MLLLGIKYLFFCNALLVQVGSVVWECNSLNTLCNVVFRDGSDALQEIGQMM